MIVPLPPLQINLPIPTGLRDRLLESLGPQLPVLVKLIIGSIVDLEREFLVLGVRRKQECGIVGFAFFRGREVSLECLLTPLAFCGVAGGYGRRWLVAEREGMDNGGIRDGCESRCGLVLSRVLQVERQCSVSYLVSCSGHVVRILPMSYLPSSDRRWTLCSCPEAVWVSAIKQRGREWESTYDTEVRLLQRLWNLLDDVIVHVIVLLVRLGRSSQIETCARSEIPILVLASPPSARYASQHFHPDSPFDTSPSRTRIREHNRNPLLGRLCQKRALLRSGILRTRQSGKIVQRRHLARR